MPSELVMESCFAFSTLWRDVDSKLKSIGAHRLIGDSSFWIWVEENPTPINEADQYRFIGFVGGHVGDFMRAGDLSNDAWRPGSKFARASTSSMPGVQRRKRTSATQASIVEVVNKNKERYVELNQDFYLRPPPLAISDERLRQDPKTTDGEMATGDAGKLNTISWRSWRLKRKAISTNDGETQATLEGEDSNFRVRFMWAQLNGCCAINEGNILDKANQLVGYVKGIVVTYSNGVSDPCNKTDAPLQGMSNARSALQGYQLKEQLKESKCRLVWVSGDWNLADSLTKKARICRDGLAQLKKNNVWRLRFA
ncbi:Transposon Ty1-NL2 Gag-Pol polyprotein [Durusdinium trenchii]|uniref:Transposon Ty1-NL2 Gag-Pol polyprotein n=1 Tax=Durusdinium trenchii TaxID=1381693 RepID=A0ABP0JCR0_9DINO